MHDAPQDAPKSAWGTKLRKGSQVSVTANEGNVFQHNEGSVRPKVGESSAETSVTSITSKSGRNVKRKIQTVTAAKRRRWNDD